MASLGASLLPYELSVCGLAEIGEVAANGVTHALSILDPGWPDPEVFLDEIQCRRAVFRFHDVIDEVNGMVAPSREDVQRILALGDRLRSDGVRHLLVHCHAGVSRSAAAAASLMAQFHPGGEDEAFHQLARIRPWSWPNSRMIIFADGLLGRRGRLIEAMRVHHGRMIERWPDLAMSLRDGERSREYWLAR